MTEATLDDEILDLAPEVLCSLLRRRSALAALARPGSDVHESERADGASLATSGRLRAVWL